VLLSVCVVVHPHDPPVDALLLALREQSTGPTAIEVVLVGSPSYDTSSADGLTVTVVAGNGDHGALRNLAWRAATAPGIALRLICFPHRFGPKPPSRP
jgi:hypothetical protein